MSRRERFDADWLALREPFDAAAREHAARLLRSLAAQRPASGPWRVIDLGCGTGANLRWLAPRLGGPQQWLVVDRDGELLRRWSDRPGFHSLPGGVLQRDDPGDAVQVLRRQADLNVDLEQLPWHAAHLVTASALLDLAGEAWLRRLATLATASRTALLFALNVDGRHVWRPADADDAFVAGQFAAHQGRDKGLGPALGARAAHVLADLLRAQGWRVQLARSDWWIESEAHRGALMLRTMAEGLAKAAAEQAPKDALRVHAWCRRRLTQATQSSLRVGHVDLLALPPR